MRQANEISILIVTPNGLHNFLKQYKSVDELNNASRIKLILLDEVHRVYFGPEILKSISMLINGIALKNASIIGLSATPIRQAIEYIGPILYSLSSLQAMEEPLLRYLMLAAFEPNLRAPGGIRTRDMPLTRRPLRPG